MAKFFFHESSYVDNNVNIGDNTKIWCFSHILSETTIGENCLFGYKFDVFPISELVPINPYIADDVAKYTSANR